MTTDNQHIFSEAYRNGGILTKIDFPSKKAYVVDMRILISTSVLLISLALALPSAACDRHGGMFGQLGGATWTDYNPAAAESDALFLEEQLTKWHEQNSEPAAKVKPAKPSFSKVTSRASLAAQARLAKRSKPSKETDAQAKVSLETSVKASETTSR